MPVRGGQEGVFCFETEEEKGRGMIVVGSGREEAERRSENCGKQRRPNVCQRRSGVFALTRAPDIGSLCQLHPNLNPSASSSAAAL
eukprot:1156521-Pelagomonas_calceolata.AAC.7